MERYVVYDTETLEMVGMIDPDVTDRDEHLSRCPDDINITTNTITLENSDDIVYPHMITIVDGIATYNPNPQPDPVPESQVSTFILEVNNANN